MGVQKGDRGRRVTVAHEARRQEIMQHCAALFDKEGYHKASMMMLAEAAGLSKPALYHYFPSKVSILYAIHELLMHILLDALMATRGEPDTGNRLRSACRDILRQIADHPGFVRAFIDHYGDLEGEMRARIQVRRREYLDEIVAIIANGMSEGQFRECDPVITAYGFLGMCNWASKWYASVAATRTPDEVAAALCLPFLEGLRADRTG